MISIHIIGNMNACLVLSVVKLVNIKKDQENEWFFHGRSITEACYLNERLSLVPFSVPSYRHNNLCFLFHLECKESNEILKFNVG